MFIFKAVSAVLGPMVRIPTVEAGERHIFLAMSARWPAGTSGDAAFGVPLAGEVGVARGTSSKIGSGIYSVDVQGESVDLKAEKLLVQFRREGMVEKVWEHIQDEFKRLNGP
jgi:hypothetical protein